MPVSAKIPACQLDVKRRPVISPYLFCTDEAAVSAAADDRIATGAAVIGYKTAKPPATAA